MNKFLSQLFENSINSYKYNEVLTLKISMKIVKIIKRYLNKSESFCSRVNFPVKKNSSLYIIFVSTIRVKRYDTFVTSISKISQNKFCKELSFIFTK